VPGGRAFIFLAGASILWVLAYAMEKAGTLDQTRFFWFKVQSVILLPIASIALCFSLDYAGMGKWLTRRAIVLLAVIPIVFVLLALTNGVQSLLPTTLRFQEWFRSRL
jgi:hypothetical protein